MDLCPDDPAKVDPGLCGCGLGDEDSDGDETRDCEDECPDDPRKIAPGRCGCAVDDDDSDGDGTPNCVDECPADGDKIERGQCGCGRPEGDADGDGTPDCDDACPADPEKIEPGSCGCDRRDTDSDGDSTADCDDGCPADAAKTEAGRCGCGVPDLDLDADGTPDCGDACPDDPDKIVPGQCGCGTSDRDRDGDGTPDCLDRCTLSPLKVDPGVCGCRRLDTDTDADGTPDCIDACQQDPAKTIPGACGCGIADTDGDGDATPDCLDACAEDSEKLELGQCGCGVSDVDSDGDGTPDCEDECPADSGKVDPGNCGCGTSDLDTDADGTPDCLDLCLRTPEKIAPGVCGCRTPDTDSDGDGTPDCVDACSDDPDKVAVGACGCGVADTESDRDATPDCLDRCPGAPGKTEPGVCGCRTPDTDSDGDGAPNCIDGCPEDPAKQAAGVCGCGAADDDTDGDGTVDCEDACSDDPDKIAAGACGCGVADADSDADGTPDCLDRCPGAPGKTEPGICGCRTPDEDSDNDGVADCIDGCDLDPLKVAPGQCGCGAPDVDSDRDGTADCADDCPADPNKTRTGRCGCGEPETDSDADGYPDCADRCPDSPPDMPDPGICGCGPTTQDRDGDGLTDCMDDCMEDPDKFDPGACGCGVPDVDSDGDGTLDCNDGCPDDQNKLDPGQCGCGVLDDGDSDGDGVADCDDPCPFDPNDDSDGDGICDGDDNCPDTPNRDQADADGDRIGDACEATACGNDRLDPGEECDDGGREPGDGCDAECRVEPVAIDGGGDFPAGFAPGSLDRFTFGLAAQTAIHLETTDGTDGCPGDTVLALFDVGGAEPVVIADDDDSGPAACSRLRGTLPPGEYELIAFGYGGESVDPYVLAARFGAADLCGNGRIDPGETCDDGGRIANDGCSSNCQIEAVDISAGGDFPGGFGVGQSNLFTFRLDASAPTGLTTSDGDGACPGDTFMSLYLLAFDGSLIAIVDDDDSGIDRCARLVEQLDAGRYLLVVRGFDDDVVPAYTLTASFGVEPICGNGTIESGEQCDDGNDISGDGCADTCFVEPVDINGGGIYAGGFDHGSFDLYIFTVDATTPVDFEVQDPDGGCAGLDTVTVLYVLSGNQVQFVTSDNNGGIGNCSRLTRDVDAGNYILQIRQVSMLAVDDYRLIARFGAPSTCGNGRIDAGEECDDGGRAGGDGCDIDCRSEPVDISAGGDFGGDFDANGLDRYVFSVDEPTLATLEMVKGGAGCRGNAVAILYRLAPGGAHTRMQSDAESGANRCPSLVGELVAGDYELTVDGASALRDYTLRATFEPLAVCGDGRQDVGEDCDDGNALDGDGCRHDCRVELCGDGIIGDGEQCDDGNRSTGDGCSAACVTECGNGRLDPIPLSNLLSPAITRLDFIYLVAACDPEESEVVILIDGQIALQEPLTENCLCNPGVRSVTIEDPQLLAAFRGDPARVEFRARGSFGGWVVMRVNDALDLVLFDAGGGADAINRTDDLCAGGNVFEPRTTYRLYREGCDDGNIDAGDGCSPICEPEICGNRIIDLGEGCDDGNTDDGDGCSADCAVESCGNGVLDPGEGCDDGDRAGGDGCSPDCQIEACGNGRLDASEQCDDAGLAPGDGCSPQCKLETCGNGFIDFGETCDDGNLSNSNLSNGNLSNGNGCSDTCRLEDCVFGLDHDGDGLDDCVETRTGIYAGPTDAGTDPFNPDTDGDNISDGDEVLGTADGLNLPALGASPLRQDIFIEIDWFDDALDCDPHSHRPTNRSINELVEMFARSPILNPDGTTGIDLHVDYGQGGVYAAGTHIGGDTNLENNLSGDFLGYKARYFSANREGFFHYAIAAHMFDSNPGFAGIAEIGGDDLIIATACSPDDDFFVASTLGHELGHNLGLRHGGFEHCNYKPNYNSIMNYRHIPYGADLTCDAVGDFSLDFSHGHMLDLDEKSIDESIGVCGEPAIDWDGDGVTESGYSRDLNSADEFQLDNCGDTLTRLRDHDDWAGLFLGGTGDVADRPANPPIVICNPPRPR